MKFLDAINESDRILGRFLNKEITKDQYLELISMIK